MSKDTKRSGLHYSSYHTLRLALFCIYNPSKALYLYGQEGQIMYRLKLIVCLVLSDVNVFLKLNCEHEKRKKNNLSMA